jgi:RNA polymerase sigma-70 factor (ECF subfamily)
MAPAPERPDEMRLIERLQARDPRAMAELYDSYARVVYTVIFRIVRDAALAEDLSQETFLRAWTAIHRYDEMRGGLAGWIAAIARNRAIDHLRSSSFRLSHHTVDVEAAGQESLTVEPEDCLAQLDQGRLLKRAFAAIPSSQQALLNLWCHEGLSHREIAARVRQPLGTVKTRIRSALLAMRSQLESA